MSFGAGRKRRVKGKGDGMERKGSLLIQRGKDRDTAVNGGEVEERDAGGG